MNSVNSTHHMPENGQISGARTFSFAALTCNPGSNFAYEIFIALVFALSLFNISTADAQTSQDIFGKRRVQYKQMDRQYISSTNFDIYYYEGGDEIARNAIQFAEADFERITELLGYSPTTKIKLYIYNSLSDLRQSNVGLDDENSSAGGKTNFVKSIIEVPFTGNQAGFRREITLGMSRTLIFAMMYGGSLKDVVQNSYLLTLPEWFVGGATLYAAEGWSREMDDYMRDAMLHNRIRRPGTLPDKEAAIAGQSIWNFIAEKYGKTTVSNILNLTRILRNEETGISSTIGVSWDRLLRDWRQYYKSMAESVAESNSVPNANLRVRKHNMHSLVYNEVRLSADASHIAYSINNSGRYKIILQDVNTGYRKVIYKGGYKVLSQRVDYTEPHIAYQGNEQVHAVVVKRGKNVLLSYHIPSGKSYFTPLPAFSQVTGFDVTPDGKYFIFSAEKDGGNDLFLFSINTGKTSRVTHDLYDDLDPHFAGSYTRILFSSNRPTDSVYTNKPIGVQTGNSFDVFMLKSGNALLTRFSETPHNERCPQLLNDSTLTWLSDENGILNLEKYEINTRRTTGLTDYRQSITALDVNAEHRMFAFRTVDDGKEYLYLRRDLDLNQELNTLPTRRRELMNESLYGRASGMGRPVPATRKTGTDTAKTGLSVHTGNYYPSDTLGKDEIDIRNYVFESEKVKKAKPAPVPAPSANTTSQGNNAGGPKKTDKAANKARKDALALLNLTGPYPYRNRMSMDNVLTAPKWDNLLHAGLEIGTGMTDMFENHKINANAFVSTDLKSSKMDLKYAFLKHRVDFFAGFTKNSLFLQSVESANNFYERYNLVRAEAGASYPFSVFSALNFSPFYARTKYTTLGTAPQQLITPDVFRHYFGFKTEFVFDNTRMSGLNITEGTRFKAKLEHQYGMHDHKRTFGSFMLDLRHYQKVHKEIVLALRGSAGRYYGPAAKKFLIGGMDNWVTWDENISANANDPLNVNPANSEGATDMLFNSYVTNLRGFKYNTMYGNSYMLFNAELRVPIVRYFYRGPITSNFLRNLQFVAFTDAGTAFSGSNPFSTNNSYNTHTVQSEGTNNTYPFIIQVTNFRNPFMYSYGGGVRTMVLGYFLKVDVAQGIKDYKKQSLRYYITLGYDF
ncbi:MAG: hypothetical protein V4543_00370 [Bacteroidota bacterium]